MPLRDHFRPPVSTRSSWEGFHAQWPAIVVQYLAEKLPEGFVAEPRIHLGSYFEVDIAGLEEQAGLEEEACFDEEINDFARDQTANVISHSHSTSGTSGTSTSAQWAPPAPTLTIEAEFPEQYAYEVLVFDASRNRRLVAAVEFVSPANKDRPDSRNAFAAKCAALLQKGVSLSIVDLVTTRRFNLYLELLALVEHTDPAFGGESPPIYAATCRQRRASDGPKIDCWALPLAIGAPLPIIPLWLNETDAVSLDLEPSYEQTCRILRIR